MKKIFLFIFIAIMSSLANAQIYSSDVLIFLDVNSDINNSKATCIIAKVNGTKVQHVTYDVSFIKRFLKKNINYFETEYKFPDTSKYDSSRSTNSYSVYSYYVSANPMWGMPSGYWCLAISKDKSSAIRWYEVEDKITSKKEYVRVDKSEFLPKAVNRDFLE